MHLSKSLDKPFEENFRDAYRVLQYLTNSRNKSLVLRKENNYDTYGLNAYSDADWASDAKTRKSTSGGVIFLGSSLVYWSSKQQSNISLSSCESEFIAASELGRELIFLRWLTTEIYTYLEKKSNIKNVLTKLAHPSRFRMDNKG
jgi:hypothetical protein